MCPWLAAMVKPSSTRRNDGPGLMFAENPSTLPSILCRCCTSPGRTLVGVRAGGGETEERGAKLM